MSKKKSGDAPQIFAVSRDKKGLSLSRRGFMTAGAGAMLAAGVARASEQPSIGGSHDELKAHSSNVSSVAFSPDGTLLASGSYDDTIKLWSIPGGELLKTLKGHEVRVLSVAFSPDGTLLASGSWNETIKLWSIPGGELLKTLEGNSEWVFAVAFSPDGTCWLREVGTTRSSSGRFPMER